MGGASRGLEAVALDADGGEAVDVLVARFGFAREPCRVVRVREVAFFEEVSVLCECPHDALPVPPDARMVKSVASPPPA